MKHTKTYKNVNAAKLGSSLVNRTLDLLLISNVTDNGKCYIVETNEGMCINTSNSTFSLVTIFLYNRS